MVPHQLKASWWRPHVFDFEAAFLLERNERHDQELRETLQGMQIKQAAENQAWKTTSQRQRRLHATLEKNLC